MTLHFLFTQFEFTHAVGPHAGRYVVAAGSADPAALLDPVAVVAGEERGETRVEARNRDAAGVTLGIGDSDVLVIGVRGTPVRTQRGLLRRARIAEHDDKEPASVPISVVTFIGATEPLRSGSEAKERLEAIRYSEPEQHKWVQRGFEALNLAIRAYRLRAPDPYATEVTRRDARLVLIGHGTTDQVGHGRYTRAISVPPPPTRRRTRLELLRPSEAVATVLAGHQRLFEAEDVLSRALIDLDHGRTRAAAIQVAAAMRLLRDEVFELTDQSDIDTAKLAEQSDIAHRLAAAADSGPLDGAQVTELGAVIDHVADVVDTWRTGPIPR